MSTSGTPLTTTRMASKAGAIELPGGQWQFANALQLGVFRHYCNLQARRFDNTTEPARPLATLHVDGAEVRVDWHQAAPFEGEVEVYVRPVVADDAAKQQQQAAARYEWLRKAYVDFDDDDVCNTALLPLGLCYTPEEVDQAIDRELARIAAESSI